MASTWATLFGPSLKRAPCLGHLVHTPEVSFEEGII